MVSIYSSAVSRATRQLKPASPLHALLLRTGFSLLPAFARGKDLWELKARLTPQSYKIEVFFTNKFVWEKKKEEEKLELQIHNIVRNTEYRV